MWVCAKCFKENATTDERCSNCERFRNNEKVVVETHSDQVSEVFPCSQCGSPTELQDPCSKCRTKQLKVAVVRPVSNAPCDGVNVYHKEERSPNTSRELRIVLLGKTGAGKSATANTILNEDLFVSKPSMKSVTNKCQHQKKEIHGRNVLIVDTPGLLDTRMDKKMVDLEIKKSVVISSPGPHAFLLVISLAGRFTAEEEMVLSQLKFLFEGSIMKYLIVVFTRKEELKGRTLEEYIEEAPDALKQYSKEAGGGYTVFNNRGDTIEKEKDSFGLIERIDKMMKRNEDDHFSSVMFTEAEELMQVKLAVELEKEKLKMRKEIEQELRAEIEETMRKEQDHSTQLQKRNDDLADQVEVLELELKAEKEKTAEKLSTPQDKEKALGQLIHKEMETNQKKANLIHQIERTDGEEKRETRQTLAHVGEQIKQIVSQRKKVQKEIADQKMSVALDRRADILRANEREKIEKEEELTLDHFTKGMENIVPSFIKFFSNPR